MFVLLETHASQDKFDKLKTCFKGFDIFWRAATRNSRFGRAIGGCVYGVKKELAERGIQYSFEVIGSIDVIRIVLKEVTFHILPFYIRGIEWKNEFEVVKNFFTNTNTLNPIIIGDMNVRIGEIQQSLEDVQKNRFAAGTEKRVSCDKVVNSKGREFVEFCNDHGLVILNGYTIGDEQGNYTFISKVGTSVNDICAISQDMLAYVKNFSVGEKIWSDHQPIQLTLQFDEESRKKDVLRLLPKLQWKDGNKLQFQQRQLCNLTELKERCEEINLKDLEKVIKASVISKEVGTRFYTPKNIWFDLKCIKSRKKSFEMLKRFRKSKSVLDKEEYLKANNYYRLVCQKAKIDYYQELERKINTVRDGKHWWKLLKEIRGGSFQIGTEVSASIFRNYFQSLLNSPMESSKIQYAAQLYRNEELDRQITTEEIVGVLSKMKLNKAPGEDRIPYEFLIYSTKEFLDELANGYNAIFESGKVDESFTKSIVFPIFKKGNANDPCNYRGISFMNCIPKVMMGILNERLSTWAENNNILNEYQAGFRKRYSTVDNIYNLTSLVHLKFEENKKVYAFFVDFKAAFDKVSRNALVYKLHSMGVSTKVIKLIENIYSNTKTAIWTGNELSEYFETFAGVKQGCLLSPLLFTFYLNDLHDYLKGGIQIDGLNVRLLMYADDLVIVADDIKILQEMMNRLEKYCELWNMEVNLNKSEIMVFRKGGKLSSKEKWFYKGNAVRIVSEYVYLGVLLTPRVVFNKHIEKRNLSAKNGINLSWQNVLSKNDISVRAKYKLFLAVCRAVQTYGAEVWGYKYYEEVFKLQKYFLKRILKLPSFSPTYVVMMETAVDDTNLFTLDLHLRYVKKTLFEHEDRRLTRQLSLKILEKNIFWAKEINKLCAVDGMTWDLNNLNVQTWNSKRIELLRLEKLKKNEEMRLNLQSSSRIYKSLDHTKGPFYINGNYDINSISWIIKARGDLIKLNGSESKLCSLCNLREIETLQHFLGACPILGEFRYRYFGKNQLTELEIVNVLDGLYVNSWKNLVKYICVALRYRNELINEFNV